MTEPSHAQSRRARASMGDDQGVQWVPAVSATILSAPLLSLSLLDWLERLLPASEVAHSVPAANLVTFAGVTRHVLPILLGVGLLVLTWRIAFRGRAKGTWASAFAAVTIGIAVLL